MIVNNFDEAFWDETPQPDASELASQLVTLLCISIMSCLFGIKTFNVQFKYLSLSRWLVIMLYIFSWAFTVTAMVLVSTNNEKVWVVSAVRQPRMETLSYKIHCLMMTPYIGILTLMLIFHLIELDKTGMCFVGLQPVASYPLLVFNMYMTILFVKPLLKIGKSVKTEGRASRLHEVAKRTLVASIVSLLVSFGNILTIILLNGRERGVLCLTCCIVDVTINVITIHWVTTNPNGRTSKENGYNSNSIPNESGSRSTERRQDQSQGHVSSHKSQYAFTGQEGDDVPPYTTDVELISPSYVNSRFMMTTQKGDGDDDDDEAGFDSRASSTRDSNSSRKSLTNMYTTSYSETL
ncbi:hypothetical protein DFQ30_007751 [Apophysomyces sp. BC1015]|nr:hypothetical protein DFQ30_007751 [Apophysomyces sp. BC1015]KAG0180215.1 hypothetical protein DFQ29_001037 [Apophysomyces sp. BC1021]